MNPTVHIPTAHARKSSRLWRVAGVLALAHIVVMFGSFGLQQVAPLDADATTVTADHVTSSLAKGLTGGYLTMISYLLLLLVATLLARLLRSATDLSGWLTGAMTASAAVFVAVTFSAMADLGAALYDGHHGASVETVTSLDHTHWFGIFLATAALGVFTAAAGAAILESGALPRWVGYFGAVVGVTSVISVVGAGAGFVDTVTLLWTLWFVCLAVSCLRHAAASRQDTAGDSSGESSMMPAAGA
ncbi:MAG: DUF4386 family protein [Actinomycetales bacterium]|nr:DUF4386 family protein [Actinomycetales bacterium]